MRVLINDLITTDRNGLSDHGLGFSKILNSRVLTSALASHTAQIGDLGQSLDLSFFLRNSNPDLTVYVSVRMSLREC